MSLVGSVLPPDVDQTCEEVGFVAVERRGLLALEHLLLLVHLLLLKAGGAACLGQSLLP